MKNLVFLLMFLIHGCFCPGVFAQTTPNTQTIFDYIDSKDNFIKNPYGRLNTLNVTLVGTATKNRTTGSSKFKGLASLTCSGPALNDACRADIRTPTAPWNSPNKMCDVVVWYEGTTSNLYSLKVTPSGGSTSTVQFGTTTAGQMREAYVTLACAGVPPTVEVVRNLAGSPTNLEFGWYYGPTLRLGEIGASSYKVGSIAISGCAGNWSSSSTSWVSFPVQTGCVYTPTGDLLAPTTMIPGFRLASVRGDGTYRITYTGSRYKNNTAPGTVNYRFFDGVKFTEGFPVGLSATSDFITEGIVADLDYTAPQGDTTFQIQAQSSASNSTSLLMGRFDVTFIPRVGTQPAASLDNLDTAQINYVPTVTGLGTGTMTFPIADTNYYTLTGSMASVCIRALSGTAGSGSARFEMSLPPGVTVNDNITAYGTSINNSYPLSLLQSKLIFTNNGNPVLGSGISAGSFYGGCVTFPTTSKKPANGVINLNFPLKNIVRLTTTGAGIYIPTPGTQWIEVEMVSGGGGSAGSGGAGASAGGAGGTTSFGTSLITATGGAGGTVGGQGGSSGSVTVNAPAVLTSAQSGGSGAGGFGAGNYFVGGSGGNSCYGGAGGGTVAANGTPGGANTGSGAGAAGTAGTGVTSGAGGGPGACIKARILNPSGSYPYNVAVGGAAGAAGANGYAGAVGGTGVLIITEHFTTFDPSTASAIIRAASGTNVSMVSDKDITIRAIVNNNGTTCSISSGSTGAWGTPTRNGPGRCGLPINPGVYSATPTCACSPNLSNAGGCGLDNGVAFSPTNTGFRVSQGGTETDLTMTVICVGPRP